MVRHWINQNQLISPKLVYDLMFVFSGSDITNIHPQVCLLYGIRSAKMVQTAEKQLLRWFYEESDSDVSLCLLLLLSF